MRNSLPESDQQAAVGASDQELGVEVITIEDKAEGDHVGQRGRSNSAVHIANLEKQFRRAGGGYVTAVDDVTLEIERGEMVVVLGPSGCGKTTLLRCVAGLEEPTRGEIWSKGRLLSSDDGVLVSPERRDFGMMFQSYAVWPHMSVFKNVAYPLRVRRLPKEEIEERVTKILDMVGIGHLQDEFSAQLSGGQQQRIALARSLVADPEVILFDEPLSNVDAKVREELRIELLTMQKRIGFAGIYVTHDQEEAMSIADRVVVMNDGKVVQSGPPRDIYTEPQSRFVAGFIGVINEWVGEVVAVNAESGLTTVSAEVGEINVTTTKLPVGARSGDRVVVIVRPEAVTVSSHEPADVAHMNVWSGTLRADMFRGAHKDYVVEVGSNSVRSRLSSHNELIAEGERVFVTVAADSMRVLELPAGNIEEDAGLGSQPETDLGD